MIGFIFTRHVNSEETNKYWIEAYTQIRKFYPDNKIMIIDDDSDYQYIKQPESLHITNTFIVQSMYPKSGELLAYYYFHKYNLFDKAVIIHDSSFIQEHIDFDQVEDIKFFWHFIHDWDNTGLETSLIKSALSNSTSLLNIYEQKTSWYGAFGLQSVITRDFINKLQDNYKIFNLLEHVNTRVKRMATERIFGLLCSAMKPDLVDDISCFGRIHDYCKWGLTYKEYKNSPSLSHPIVKVWSSR